MDKKKRTCLIISLLFIVIAILTYLLLQKYILKSNFEKEILPIANKNNKTVFQINKIVLFSNCDAKNKTSSSTHFTIENLYQYTDFAIFINHASTEEKTLENTLKKVKISNIHYTTSPTIGEPKLYFKGLHQFSKSNIVTENEIKDVLDFTITSDNEADLDTPILYNNLANPITLSYVNQNIKSDYTVTDTSNPITYDGSLLKKCKVDLDSIACQLCFDIYITNHLEQEFKTTVFINIPLKTQTKSMYDGNIKETLNTHFVFYRYQ